MHVLAGTVAGTCEDSCRYLRGRLQVRASEKGKTGTEIVRPILDKGGETHPIRDAVAPQIYLVIRK